MVILNVSNKFDIAHDKKNVHTIPVIQTRPIMRTGDMMNTLGLIGKINMADITFGAKKQKTYAGLKLSFPEAELDRRLDKDHSRTIKLLPANSPHYNNLAEGDKKALGHLVKVADILNEVFLAMDHEKNIEFRNALKTEAKKGDTQAKKTLTLFHAMDGIAGIDSESKMTFLAKGIKQEDGRNFYSPGTTAAELNAVVTKKLDEGKNDEVQSILSQRTIVRRTPEGDLKATDYIDAFPKEFHAAADELDKAAKVSTNAQFNEYLTAQAQAFRKADPELDCHADKLWAQMQDTPLEFTITREQYADRLTDTIVDDEALKKRLESQKIDVQSKDALGIRVGIVNKKGTEDLYDFKKYLPALADEMPLKHLYKQSISSTGDTKQTMVDVDIVAVKGDVGAFRGGITLAENLPNDDKLSVKRGNGRRNVYHRQIRQGADPKKIKQRLDATLNPAQHKYYVEGSDHKFTIGHENAHSLGPTEAKSKLGKWSNIVEENKADMGSVASLDFLVSKGKYTEKEKKEILITFANGLLLKAKPKLKQAHRVRSVMQANYFIKKGAMKVDEKGILTVNLDKMVPTAKSMLEDIVKLQLSEDPTKAATFVKKNFKWTAELEQSAKNIREINKTIHGLVESPLADKLLRAAKK